MKKKVITIDGPAASGKSSLSRELARKLNWNWLSTGAFYRTLGYLAHLKNVDQSDEDALVDLLSSTNFKVVPDPIQTKVFIDEKACALDEIYSVENGTRASNVSRFPKVREEVLDLQRSCYTDPGLIAEGRDCGTVIFPDAQLKIYLEADSKARAQRRADEKLNEGSVEEVEEALKTRDQQDSQRKTAPMEAAPDALIIDTSKLSLAEVVNLVFEKAEKKFS